MKKTLYSVSDIPETLNQENKELIQMTFKGYQTTPKKVMLYVMESANEVGAEYTTLEKYMDTVRFNWLAAPYAESDGKTEELATWIKGQRAVKKTVKAVLSNVPADTEGVVDVAASLYKDEKEYTPERVTARVSGMIAGTPLTMSCTYAPLTDFTDCTRMTSDEVDTAVDAGKFIFIWDGEKVKVCRGVSSFVTVTPEKGDSFKKIKIVEIMDMIQDDISMTVQDDYIGKYANTYDNKCLLITAINQYFAELIRSGILSKGSCGIDMDAQRDYLRSKGKPVDDMDDQEIKEENTGSNVFLEAEVSILDAIEDISLKIYI